jgi:hypothetical protein
MKLTYLLAINKCVFSYLLMFFYSHCTEKSSYDFY